MIDMYTYSNKRSVNFYFFYLRTFLSPILYVYKSIINIFFHFFFFFLNISYSNIFSKTHTLYVALDRFSYHPAISAGRINSALAWPFPRRACKRVNDRAHLIVAREKLLNPAPGSAGEMMSAVSAGRGVGVAYIYADVVYSRRVGSYVDSRGNEDPLLSFFPLFPILYLVRTTAIF